VTFLRDINVLIALIARQRSTGAGLPRVSLAAPARGSRPHTAPPSSGARRPSRPSRTLLGRQIALIGFAGSPWTVADGRRNFTWGRFGRFRRRLLSAHERRPERIQPR
jgi:hypothetical protein